MASEMKSAQSQLTSIGKSVESQSLNIMAAGFTFAAAIAWMDVVRAIVNLVVKTNKNGVVNSALTALLTTLLSVVVYIVLKRVSGTVKAPTQPIFAVTA
jgi:hypothetical protein